MGSTSPFVVNSLTEFLREFGSFAESEYLSHAASGYFGSGGASLVVVRSEGSDDNSMTAAIQKLADQSVTHIAAPGVTTTVVIAALIAQAEQKQDRLAIIDSPADSSPKGVAQAHSSSYAALYYPWLKANDHVDGIVDAPPSAFVLGAHAAAERSGGVTADTSSALLSGTYGVSTELLQGWIDDYTNFRVNVIGSANGVEILTGNTLAPGFDIVDRRALNMLAQSIAKGTRYGLSWPNGQDLWCKLDASLQTFLKAQWSAGSISGATEEAAYSVLANDSNNPNTDEVVIDVNLSLPSGKGAVFKITHTAQTTVITGLE